jgi:uncharacterized membrane protein YadS
MTLISSTKLAESLNGGADARLTTTIRRWPGRNSREILPGLFLNSVIAGAAFVIRQLPGMATFSPIILSMAIGIAFQNIVGTAAWAKQGVTFSLRWLLCITNFPFGLPLTSSQFIEIGGGGLGIIVTTVRACFAFTIWMGQLLGLDPTLAQLIAAGTSICGASAVIAANTQDEGVACAIACITVSASVAMFAYPIRANAKGWIVAVTTFLQSIAPTAMALKANIGRPTAIELRPAVLGALAFLFIAGFSLTRIKSTE